MPPMMKWSLAIGVLLGTSACGGSTQTAPQAAETPAPEPASEPASGSAAASSGSSQTPAATGNDESLLGSEDPANRAPSKGEASTGASETRTTEVIQKIIMANRQPVRDCYEKARKDLPTLKGDMTIHFVLDPDGKVKTAELNQERSTLKSPAVVTCALEVLKKIKFPPSSRGMDSTINYPFNFKSGQ
jgi:outer membrane biosynthesis protein TonB